MATQEEKANYKVNLHKAIGRFVIEFELLTTSLRHNLSFRFSNREMDGYLIRLLTNELAVGAILRKVRSVIAHIEPEEIDLINSLLSACETIISIRNDFVHGLWGLNVSTLFDGGAEPEKPVSSIFKKPKNNLAADFEIRHYSVEDINELSAYVTKAKTFIQSLIEVSPTVKYTEKVDRKQLEFLIDNIKSFNEKIIKINSL